MRRVVLLQGATAIAAVAGMILMVLATGRLQRISTENREVRREIVQLLLPRGVKGLKIREEVLPGTPGHSHASGGLPTPA